MLGGVSVNRPWSATRTRSARGRGGGHRVFEDSLNHLALDDLQRGRPREVGEDLDGFRPRVLGDPFALEEGLQLGQRRGGRARLEDQGGARAFAEAGGRERDERRPLERRGGPGGGGD